MSAGTGIFVGAKLASILKGAIVGGALFATAAVVGLPVHDIWFDWVLFFILSALVGGAPEPDTNLPPWRFFYTWFYRSGHLLVASATAYFLHQKRWDSISEGQK